MSHEWKSASSRKDAVSMLRILFLPATKGGTGSIIENLILWEKKHTNNKMLLIIIIIIALSYGLPREMLYDLYKENSLSTQ